MNLRDFLQQWGLTGLKLNPGFLGADFAPNDLDRAAAWDLYVELLTRITTQYLPPDAGDEKTALYSVYKLFPLTREILKKHGAGAGEFAKIAIPVLNQIIRPFTAKWHRLALAKGLKSPAQRTRFRKELSELQLTLRNYARVLAAMAAVEDLTALEDTRS